MANEVVIPEDLRERAKKLVADTYKSHRFGDAPAWFDASVALAARALAAEDSNATLTQQLEEARQNGKRWANRANELEIRVRQLEMQEHDEPEVDNLKSASPAVLRSLVRFHQRRAELTAKELAALKSENAALKQPVIPPQAMQTVCGGALTFEASGTAAQGPWVVPVVLPTPAEGS